MENQYYDYIKALKAPTIYPAVQLQFLNPDDTVDFVIDDKYVINDGSTLTVNNQNGTRRTATIKLDNEAREFEPKLDRIWIGTKVRLMAGLKLFDGTPYLRSQGIFYITNPSEAYTPTDRSITLNLVDKWAWLDGTLNGNLDGIYQINPGDNLYTAVTALLKKDSGNGQPLDSMPPVLDSYYLDKTAQVANGDTVPFLNAPYTLRTEATENYATVLLGINTMLVSSCGYDNSGRLTYKSAQTDIFDYNRPVAWDFKITEREFLGATYTHGFAEAYNDVKVIGAVLNGKQIQGRATNKNPKSDLCVQKIGYKTYPAITQSKYYTVKQCSEYARYELAKRTMVQKTVSFTTSPIYHLQENDLVTLLRSDISDTPEKYMVTGFTLPLGGTGTMTINAVSVEDADIFSGWDAAYNLGVLCAEKDALQIKYTSGGSTVTAKLDNPYTVLEVPQGATVIFEAVKESGASGVAYTIQSAYLNGIAQAHEGHECLIVMPEYDSEIEFSLTPTNGADLIVSYTGTIVETEDTAGCHYRTFNGVKYRAFRLETSGTLTFNSAQLARGIVGDLHLRGGGGGGNATQSGGWGYDSIYYGVNLENYTVTIGSGGATDPDAAKRGGATSCGSLMTAPGGGGATGDSEGVGGKDLDVFEALDTVTGRGGAPNSSGTKGRVWLRVAI